MSNKSETETKSKVKVKPFVGTMPVRKIGGSAYLLLPRDWMEDHGDPDKLLVIADSGIKVLPVEDAPAVYKRVTELVNSEDEKGSDT